VRLTEAQSQRHAALQAAIGVTEGTSIGQTPEVLIALGMWILDGKEPGPRVADVVSQHPTLLAKVEKLRGA